MPAPRKPAGKKLERVTDIAWWCPHCDHANTLLYDTCGKCGAVRDGDTVRPASD